MCTDLQSNSTTTLTVCYCISTNTCIDLLFCGCCWALEEPNNHPSLELLLKSAAALCFDCVQFSLGGRHTFKLLQTVHYSDVSRFPRLPHGTVFTVSWRFNPLKQQFEWRPMTKLRTSTLLQHLWCWWDRVFQVKILFAASACKVQACSFNPLLFLPNLSELH